MARKQSSRVSSVKRRSAAQKSRATSRTPSRSKSSGKSKSKRIKFSCKCGKTFVESARHAGRRVRCRTCGAIIRIPQPKKRIVATLVQLVATEKPDKSDPHQVAFSDVVDSEGKILFECACGHKFRVGEQHSGRKAQCPTCNRFLRVPKIMTAEEMAKAGSKVKKKKISDKKPSAKDNKKISETEATDEEVDISIEALEKIGDTGGISPEDFDSTITDVLGLDEIPEEVLEEDSEAEGAVGRVTLC